MLLLLLVGIVGWAQGEWRHLCNKSVEEGQHSAGRRRRVHHDWEESASVVRQTSIPLRSPLELSDAGQSPPTTTTRWTLVIVTACVAVCWRELFRWNARRYCNCVLWNYWLDSVHDCI